MFSEGTNPRAGLLLSSWSKNAQTLKSAKSELGSEAPVISEGQHHAQEGARAIVSSQASELPANTNALDSEHRKRHSSMAGNQRAEQAPAAPHGPVTGSGGGEEGLTEAVPEDAPVSLV